MHMASFRMLTVKHVKQLIQQGDYAFSIDLKDAYLHISIVKNQSFFLQLDWQNKPYQWEVLPLELIMVSGFSHHSLSPYCSFAIARIFALLLDDILVLTHS